METAAFAFRNKYIDLVASKSVLIAGDEGQKLSQATVETLRARLQPRIFLELGSGSGGHLIEIAARNPEVLCVGIEKRYKRTFRTAEKAEKRGITNLLMLRTDARFLAELFPESSIERVYVNFPDPWDRKRWKKNRLLSESSLRTLARVVKSGADLRFKTDHPGYFNDTLEILKDHADFMLRKQTSNLHQSPLGSENIVTEFESLFLSQGLPIHFLEAKRR